MRILSCVTDEVVTIPPACQYRVQVWRGRELTPVVMLIQLPHQPPPRYYMTRLAQHSLQCFLGFSLPIPVVFTYERKEKKPFAQRATFECTGNPLRPILCNPTIHTVDAASIGKIFNLSPLGAT
jgi:hypothetical protein